MKLFLAAILFACAFIGTNSMAMPRETGGNPTFENSLRSTDFGKSVLPAIEASLIERGFERAEGDMSVTWFNEGENFQAVIWYRSTSSFATVQILLKGGFGRALTLDSIQVMKQNP